MLRILIEDSEGKSKIAPINPDSDITIGRKEGNSIRLKERNVSRQHARIYSTPDGLFVEPVAARYGLKVNSTKIDGPTPLALGDEIRIGDYRLYLQDESQPTARPEENPDAVVDIEEQLRPRFVVISSNFAGVEYKITKSRIIIGRNPQCDIQIQHQSVSGQHIEVRRTPRGDFQVKDLESSNGTKVNGMQISEPVILNCGDIVTLGHVIMRFCAPGDLWSLNFGINDERTKLSVPLVLVLGIVVILIAVFMTAFIITKMNKQTQQPIPTATINDGSKDHKEATEALIKCQASIDEGDFIEAQEYCDKASRIDPNNSLVNIYNKKIQEGINATRSLEDAKNALAEGRCEEAKDSIDTINPTTWAYKRVVEDHLKDEVIKCSTQRLLKNARSALDNDDFATAEALRDSIRDLDAGAPEIEEINEALKAKRPSHPSRGSSDNSDKSKSNDKAAAAETPKAGKTADELCKEAAEAKLDFIRGNEDGKCKAYGLYKKALKAGGISDKYKSVALSTIEQYRSQCE